MIGEALPLLKYAEEHADIKKISIGLIKNTGRPGSPMRISVRALEQDVHGLRVTVNKGAAHQIFRFYLAPNSSKGDWKTRLESFGKTTHGKRGKRVRIRGQKNRRNDY